MNQKIVLVALIGGTLMGCGGAGWFIGAAENILEKGWGWGSLVIPALLFLAGIGLLVWGKKHMS